MLRRGRPRPPPSRSAAGTSTLSLDREVSNAPLLSMARRSGAAFLSSASRYTTPSKIQFRQVNLPCLPNIKISLLLYLDKFQ
jgi:hypothetical protein